MKHSRSTRWALMAAAAAALGVSTTLNSPVYAQQLLNNSGRARDANNRVGSNGTNDAGSPNPYSNQVNTAITFGDVTGGAAFQGKNALRDPAAFHGTLAGGNIDSFVSQSSGVTTNGVVSNNAQNVGVYLGQSRGIAPPPNFIQVGNVPGYQPLPPGLQQPFASDARLGTPTLNSSPSITTQTQLYSPAGSQVNGSVSTSSVYLQTSPLFGVKQLQKAQETQSLNGSAALATDPTSGYLMNTGPIGGNSRIDPVLVQRAKALNDESIISATGLGSLNAEGLPKTINDYNRSLLTNPNNAALNPDGTPVNGNNGLNNNPSNNNAGNNNNSNNNGTNSSNLNGVTGPGANANPNGRIDSAVNAQVGGGSLSAAPGAIPLNATVGPDRLNGGVQTGEDVTNTQLKVVLPSPAYERMLQNITRLNPNTPLTPMQKNQLFQAQQRDLKAAEAKKGQSTPTPSRVPGTNTPGNNNLVPPPGAPPASMTPGATPAPTPGAGALIPSQVPENKERPKPVMVTSFAQDEPGKGTKELLTKAEDLMKAGKFTSALEQYDLVEQAAPDNHFATLGRANAELGASYYMLAETHLRDAFMKDQALTMAQYDLNTFLGNDRIQFLIKDLKQIATTNPTQARPVFLLSYIMYNTGHPKQAAMYLNEAQKRAGGKDPLYDLLKKNWDLPDVSHEKPDGELNK